MNKTTIRRYVLGAALAALAMTFGANPALAGGKDDNGGDTNGGGSVSAVSSETRLKTRLAGAALEGLTPSGAADFRWDSARNRGRLNVEVEDVKLAEGTMVTVSWMRDMVKTTLGTIRISAAPIRGGELEFSTTDGQPVPSLKKGDVIIVDGPAGTILAGVL